MKYKSSAYTGFMQNVENQHTRERRDQVENKQQEAFPRDLSFWDDISSQKSEITLLNSNAEEESHFSFLQNPQQYKFLKTYTASLFQQFYESSLTSFIPKRKETTQGKEQGKEQAKYQAKEQDRSGTSESNQSKRREVSSGVFAAGVADFVQSPLHQVLSYWADSINRMIETKKEPNKNVVEDKVSFAKMFSKDNFAEKKSFIANVIDTIYEDKHVSIYRVKGTSMYCVNTNGSYIWNCTYNSNYDQRKSVHINKKGISHDRPEYIHIYDRKIEGSGICAFDLSAGNLGILLHHAMFYFSPETSTVQIFHLDVQLPEIKIQSSDKKRIIASIGHDIIIEKNRTASGHNTHDSSILTLNEDILPNFFQTEYHFTGTEQTEITSEDRNDTQHDLLLNHQHLKSLTFWGDILRHVPHKVSYSMFEPPSPNLYLKTFINWRNQLSPSSIAALGLLLCEELQKWMVQIKNIESIEDAIHVLEQRDRLASLAFCMRKELRSILSVFTKGDQIVHQHINDLIYAKMEEVEINKLIKQNKRLYNVRLVEPDAYWGIQKKNLSAFDVE